MKNNKKKMYRNFGVLYIVVNIVAILSLNPVSVYKNLQGAYQNKN